MVRDRRALDGRLERWRPFLPPVAWELLHRLYVQGQSYEEAQSAMQERYGWPVNVGAAKAYIYRLKKRLRGAHKPTPPGCDRTRGGIGPTRATER
jgi:hypothetical protein